MVRKSASIEFRVDLLLGFITVQFICKKRKKEKNKEGRVLTLVWSHARFAASHLTFAAASFWGPEAEAGMDVQICRLPSLVSSLQLGGNKFKVPQDRAFLRGFVTLLGFLVGLTLEGSLVGSQPKHFLLDPLSMRGSEHWEGLLPRIKANIGITCFDLKKKKCGSGEGPEGSSKVTVFCVDDTGVNCTGLAPAARSHGSVGSWVSDA